MAYDTEDSDNDSRNRMQLGSSYESRQHYQHARDHVDGASPQHHHYWGGRQQ